MTATRKPGDNEEIRCLLQHVRDFVCRYVVLSNHQADAIALWILHTHAFEAAETTPYLQITSAEKESGKTRLLEVLELVVARPWLTGRTTASTLARKVDAETPTLLLDESDVAFGGDKSYAQELRGILNSGFRRGGRHTINVPGQQSTWTPTDFSVFCPKAIAGIGSVPDTVASRSITIRLQRKRPEERVEKLRRRRAQRLAEPIRARLEQLLPKEIPELTEFAEAEPKMPRELSDRAQDVWEPLVAIADLAGGGWPERSRTAAVALFAEGRDEETSYRVRLLEDIRSIFDERNIDEITSTDLVFSLNAIEASPWGGWAHGKGLTTHSLARQLRHFRIFPRHTRDASARGYLLEQFADSFVRYLPDWGATTVKPSDEGDESREPGLPECQDAHSQDAHSSDGSGRGGSKAESNSDALTLHQPNGGLARSAASRTDGDPFAEYDDEYANAEAERLRRKFGLGGD